jgi:hypothetical protein
MRHMSEYKVAEPSVSYVAGRAQVIRDRQGRYLNADPLAQRGKLIEATLRRAATQDANKLRRACDRLLESAADGETWQERMAAFVVISDRLDGKPVARIETSDGDTRNMGLADLVQLVLNARKADAIDAQTHSQAEPGAEPAQPAE